MPTTAYSKKQLHDAAVKSGEALFGKNVSGHGFLHSSLKDTEVVKTNTHEMAKSNVENVGKTALEGLPLSTFDHVFFPSQPGKGIDHSDEDIFKNHAKLKDVDGNIYVHSAEDSSIIIIKPTIHTKAAYKAHVKKLLK